MALVTVYDQDGNEFQKESVDARECIEALGFTYEKVEEKPVEVVASVQEDEIIVTSEEVETKTRKYSKASI